MEWTREEFAAAVTEHGRRMFRAARAVLDSDADAEDAVSQAVLQAWQSLDRLKNREAVRPWLVKIAVNCAYAQRRRQGRVVYLDDLAQIAGADVLCVPAEPGRIQWALRGRNAVLLRGMGALCAGTCESDVDAVRALIAKGCAARLYARAVPGCHPLNPADAALQRLIYQKSYRGKKDLC